MKKSLFIAASIFVALLFSGCASVSCIFHCDDPSMKILVNGQYIGTGTAKFSAPHGTIYVNVYLEQDGEIVHSQKVYVRDCRNTYIEVSKPEIYRYSTIPKYHD